MSFICKSYPTRRVCNAELALFIVKGAADFSGDSALGAPGHAASFTMCGGRDSRFIRQRISNLAERPEIIDALDAVPPGDRRRARRAPSPRGKDQASKVRAKVLEFRGEDRQPRRRDGESCVEVVCTRYAGCIKFGGLRLDEP